MPSAVFCANIYDAGPALVAEVLKDRNVDVTVVDVNRQKVPNIADFDMAFFGGAPYSANARDAKTLGQIEQISLGLSQELPMLGICLGAQLLVKAAGGSVVKSLVVEEGMFDKAGAPYSVQLTSQGRKDPIFKGLGAKEFRAFHLHKMMFNLSAIPQSKGAVLLGTGRHCPNQVVRIGSGYGFQSHIEFTRESVRRLAKKPDFKVLGPNLVTDFEVFYPEYCTITRLIINNFLDIAGVR